MPLFEITNTQLRLSLQCPSYSLSLKQCIPCRWKSLDKLKKENLNVRRVDFLRGKLLIKSVATFEPKSLAATKGDKCMDSKDLELGLNPHPPEVLLEFSDEESEQLDEKEKLRRMRISKANKGNTAWNKGRKHSAETLRKIRERTWLAMQNPKVKMKLVKHRHAQTAETRLKISAGVKLRCKTRRARKMMQETCCFEWQNLIAEASRQGYVGQEELQWNSYKTLDEQLKQEWLVSVEQRKQMTRTPGSKRLPKSPEHRRKIAEAITAKWADPEYRNRVCSAIAKCHGTEAGAERKPRRRSSDGAQPTGRNPIMKKDTDRSTSIKSGPKILNPNKLKKNKIPAYKDPLVNSKLEMIKNIRKQRAAAETEQTQAIARARLLIAEAEKAAKALEVAATKSPIAQASLIETRKLIAEAIQSLESIDTQGITESNLASVALNEANNEKSSAFEAPNQVNGHKTLLSSDDKFCQEFREFSLEKLLNGDPKLHLTSTDGYASFPFSLNSQIKELSLSNQQRETEQDLSSEYKTDPSPTAVGIQSTKGETPSRSPVVAKRWVRGRLVQVSPEKHENQ